MSRLYICFWIWDATSTSFSPTAPSFKLLVKNKIISFYYSYDSSIDQIYFVYTDQTKGIISLKYLLLHYDATPNEFSICKSGTLTSGLTSSDEIYYAKLIPPFDHDCFLLISMNIKLYSYKIDLISSNSPIYFSVANVNFIIFDLVIKDLGNSLYEKYLYANRGASGQGNLIVAKINEPSSCMFYQSTEGSNIYCRHSCSNKQVKYKGKCFTCESPNVYFDPSSESCTLSCPSSNPIINMHTSTCVTQCPDGMLYFDYNNDDHADACDYECTFEGRIYYTDINERQWCLSKCPTESPILDYGLDWNTKSCVNKCNKSEIRPWLYNYNSTCLDLCMDPVPLYDLVSSQCLASCSNATSGHFLYLTNSTCIADCRDVKMYSDPISMTCLSECPSNLYADKRTEILNCLEICPVGTFVYVSGRDKQCKAICLNDLPLYDAPILPTIPGYCLSNCTLTHFNNFYLDLTTYSCVTTCNKATSGNIIDTAGNLCVKNCMNPPAGSGQYTNVLVDPAICYSKCNSTSGLYYDRNSFICTKDCSNSTSGIYIDPVLGQCVESCPSDRKYLDMYNIPINKCLSECPTNTYADKRNDNNWKCINECAIGTFIYDNGTYKECKVVCTIDKPYYDKFSNPGYCLNKCPIERPYIDFNNVCVAVCPQASNNALGTFVNEAQIKCVTTCPNYWYTDGINEFCINICPIINKLMVPSLLNKCVSDCPSNTLFLNNNTCILTCNPNFYYRGECLSKCLQYTVTDPDNFMCINCKDTEQVFYKNLCYKTKSDIPTSTILVQSDYNAYVDCQVVGMYVSNGHCVDVCPSSYQADVYGICSVYLNPVLFFIKTPAISSIDAQPKDIIISTSQSADLSKGISISMFVKQSSWTTINDSYYLFQYGTNLVLKYVISTKNLQLFNPKSNEVLSEYNNFISFKDTWVQILLSYYYDNTSNTANLDWKINSLKQTINLGVNIINLSINDVILIPKESIAIYAKIWIWDVEWLYNPSTTNMNTIFKYGNGTPKNSTCIESTNTLPSEMKCSLEYITDFDENVYTCSIQNFFSTIMYNCSPNDSTCLTNLYLTQTTNICSCYNNKMTLNDNKFWIVDDIGSDYCVKLDSINYSRYSPVTFNNLSTSGSSYTLDLWVSIQSYPGINFSSMTLEWKNQIKIVLSFLNNRYYSTCYPSLYNLNYKSTLQIDQSIGWIYIRCSVNLPTKKFVHLTGLTDVTELSLPDDVSSFSTGNTLTITDSTINYGAIFFKQIRLWNCYDCFDFDNNKLLIMSSNKATYPYLLHVFEDSNNKINDLISNSQFSLLSSSLWNGYDTINDAIYNKIESPNDFYFYPEQKLEDIETIRKIDEEVYGVYLFSDNSGTYYQDSVNGIKIQAWTDVKNLY